MVNVEELRKTIEWLRDTTNNNIIYIDKDIKRELGITINDLIRINEIYKLKIDKATEYIKNKPLYTETYDYNEEDNLELKYIDDEIAKNDLLEILGDKENE